MNYKHICKALVFVLLIMPHQLFAREEDERGSMFGKMIAYGAGAVVCVAVAPAVLTAAGFTSAGIAAGSVGSYMMSTAAVANGGGIAAGGVVAALQSAGAAGIGTAGNAVLGSVGAAAGKYLYENAEKRKHK